MAGMGGEAAVALAESFSEIGIFQTVVVNMYRFTKKIPACHCQVSMFLNKESNYICRTNFSLRARNPGREHLIPAEVCSCGCSP